MTPLGDEVGSETTGDPLKILVVDDEPAMVGALGALLGQAGHRIIAAYDGEDALRRFRDDEPDLVLLDVQMPGQNGVDSLVEILRVRPAAAVVMMTGYSVPTLLERAVEEGACEALVIWLASKGPENFAKFIQLYKGAQKPDPIFEQAYEFPLVEDMEKEFKTWVLSEW